MAESRLRSTIKKRAIHTIVLVMCGFIALFIILIFFGTNLLTGFSLFMEKLQSNNDDTATAKSQQNTAYIAPPSLDPVPNATNSAQMLVSGIAQKGQTISLYLNDQLLDKTSVDEQNHFHFSSITLQQGQNTIKTKAQTDTNKESSYSNTLTIFYSKSAPTLSLDQPQDGQGFSKSSSPSVNIEGQTDPGNKVTVNGFWAIVDDQGKYTYLYTLKDGDNDIKVVATDDAGNQTTKEIHIHTQ